jgi:hypothetical protein
LEALQGEIGGGLGDAGKSPGLLTELGGRRSTAGSEMEFLSPRRPAEAKPRGFKRPGHADGQPQPSRPLVSTLSLRRKRQAKRKQALIFSAPQ